MKTFKAADVTRNSGDLFAAAAAEPITITKHDKPRFVVMSWERFNALLASGDTRQSFKTAELPEDLKADLLAKLDADLDE